MPVIKHLLRVGATNWSPWKGQGLVIQIITPYLFKVQIKNNFSVVNHDLVKKCQDRDLPKWLIRAQQGLDRNLVYSGCRGLDTWSNAMGA
ncbi:nucleosome-remodeling factor subunit bptf [Plakobranchus ocellatus]|uniref:Nucleosome-remodeling factor subunit bptf n=1 Tax=Plakobranchus ocellatus TaxID=259542 RepID=A0AAV3ZAR6_9GAST|nr:nucleosome-remodeling factor subunit bptf [Plakobranchus ocellatus]